LAVDLSGLIRIDAEGIDKMDDLVSGCAQNVPTKEAGQAKKIP
jgi:hypothetical protein